MTDTAPTRPDSPVGIDAQPVNRVVWLPRDQLVANDYNPNKVAPPEMRLLEISILEDGWTQPIVARTAGPPYEIVDGFHRWTVSGRPAVHRLTDGHVPVVFLSASLDPAHQRMSTIRHNRARGTHAVVRMSEIVSDLLARGVPAEAIEKRLQMEDEEVGRLADQGDMLKRHAGEGFNPGWTPAYGEKE